MKERRGRPAPTTTLSGDGLSLRRGRSNHLFGLWAQGAGFGMDQLQSCSLSSGRLIYYEKYEKLLLLYYFIFAA